MVVTLPDADRETRKTVFRALVEAQDIGWPVRDSHAVIARRFALTAEQLKAIELEGVDAEWPPL